jgi:hypothetical protein
MPEPASDEFLDSHPVTARQDNRPDRLSPFSFVQSFLLRDPRRFMTGSMDHATSAAADGPEQPRSRLDRAAPLFVKLAIIHANEFAPSRFGLIDERAILPHS